MSELSRAISRLRICNIPGNPELRKQIKDAFRAGWEAREELLNKRVSAIEKAATLKERERCISIAKDHAENSMAAEEILQEIRSVK